MSRPAFDPRWEKRDSRLYYRATFGDDADAYDRSRPVAPGIVFEDMMAMAGLEVGDMVLEIGPGTGQATSKLAERGLKVLAIELGASLAAKARSKLANYGDVEVLNADFETWDSSGRTFASVFACNSFHWIDPELRFAKSAFLLLPGGHLVHMSMAWVVPDDADRFWWDVQDDYMAATGRRDDPAASHPDRVLDFGPVVDDCGLFKPSETRRYPFSVMFSTGDYLANLSTQSGIKEFEPEVRSELFRLVGRRIDALGGQIRANLLALLTVARLK